MVSGSSGLPYYVAPLVVWVKWLSTEWMTIKITTTLFTLTVWTCTAITCCTTGLTIHWDVSSRTTFFAFRLSHFVLIETSWKLDICSLRFGCLDGSLFRKTPAHCIRFGEIQAGELGPYPSESVWLEFQSLITWPQRFPVLLRQNRLLTISMWLQHFHPISYMDRIATARNSSTSPAPSPLSWDQYWLGEKGRSHDIDWERERPYTGMCWGPAKKGD